MSYSLSNNYLPPPQQPSGYYSHQTQLPPPPPPSSNSQRGQPDLNQRKRPKYTRSKTGCLTCRVKKVKCDESKPVCVRCSHGQRECTWPEGVQPRKRPVSRNDSLDARPSTAESSEGPSEGSAPSTREPSPPRRSYDLCYPPSPGTRRPGGDDSYCYSQQSFKSESDVTRPSLLLNPERSSRYTYPSPSPEGLPAAHEMYQSRYDHAYTSNSHHSRPTMSTPFRSYTHQEHVHHWHAPHNAMDSYTQYPHHGTERIVLSPSDSSNDPHHRYT
ncbi:hypothetical protein FA13DRAFT_1726481 [Coprinellus micaceus]|uniref:Zn(2)-C6 fungal-type domain-containing protein n=1 Tax=Coprinellus micaceus TaxID=71717 RepID=A0A4Y7TTZ2_COPMI|nr:hypothetical protein FA13DRAFT_1726481 [Coprinellus micaceus]